MKSLLLSPLLLLILSLIMSCRAPADQSGKEKLLSQYISVWNGESPELLDNIVDMNFQLRMVPLFNSLTGIEYLKKEIRQTRTYFPDFLIKETERLFVGDTAVVIRWTVSGNFKNKDKMSSEAGKVEVPGFSIIFFDKDKITGEWIAYSDLTWYEQLGFKLVPPSGSGI